MNKEKVSMVSLGCPKNLVDAEVMLGYLGKEGFEITTDEHEAFAERLRILTVAMALLAQELLAEVARYAAAGEA